MEFFIYIKTFFFFLLLFISGVIIIKRLTEENRAQILIPAGVMAGIALYIFLINALAHVIKGSPGFYLALAIEACIAFLAKHYIASKPMEFPKGKFSIYTNVSILLWGVFIYFFLATGDMGGDIFFHYAMATLFSRGDYPIHTPWQPDYVMTYHFGTAMFLGAARSITGGSFLFIHRLLDIFSFFLWSQFLTWVYIKKIPKNLLSMLILSVPAFVGLISLGGFMITWPTDKISVNFNGDILRWLGQLPTLNISQDSYGSPTHLDMMVTFMHRFLSISFFFSLLTILSLPKKITFY